MSQVDDRMSASVDMFCGAGGESRTGRLLFRNEGIRRFLRTFGKERIDRDHLEDIPGRDPAGTQPNSLQIPGSLDLPRRMSYNHLLGWCEQLKAAYIRKVHRDCGENVRKTTHFLGCSRDVVYKYLELEGEQGGPQAK